MCLVLFCLIFVLSFLLQVQLVQDFSFLSGGIWEGMHCLGFIKSIVGGSYLSGYCQYVVATKKRWNLRVKILTFCRVNSAALGIRAEIVVFHFAESGNGILFVCRCCQKKVDFKGREIDLLPGQQRRT
ncbi:uncharacterized protein LOC26536055 isoform X5 [Drosophila yakuba]|uniref:uncharacterized protein LOC26536055 isoform X5 n=2 Tax=Drosophila yakuba TaxID=7245 RepID=UPI001930875D|nr:uncharacterized protein LOC26536055 isoform X5 [Drosophila yakuba]